MTPLQLAELFHDTYERLPESLQNGEVAERLQARANACEEVAGEVKDAAGAVEDLIDPDMDVDDPEAAGAEQANDIISGIGWNLDP